MTESTGTLFQQTPNTMPVIKEIWAFVSVDPEDGNEGVCGVVTDGVMMPLIASDVARLEQIRPIALRLALDTDMQIKLVKFTQRVEVETL